MITSSDWRSRERLFLNELDYVNQIRILSEISRITMSIKLLELNGTTKLMNIYKSV